MVDIYIVVERGKYEPDIVCITWDFRDSYPSNAMNNSPVDNFILPNTLYTKNHRMSFIPLKGGEISSPDFPVELHSPLRPPDPVPSPS